MKIRNILFLLLLCVASFGFAQDTEGDYVEPGTSTTTMKITIDSISVFNYVTGELLITVKGVNDLTDDVLDKLNKENGMPNRFKTIYYTEQGGIKSEYEGTIGRQPEETVPITQEF